MAFNKTGHNISIDELYAKVERIKELTGVRYLLIYNPGRSAYSLNFADASQQADDYPHGIIGRSRAEANKVLDAIIGGITLAAKNQINVIDELRLQHARKILSRL